MVKLKKLGPFFYIQNVATSIICRLMLRSLCKGFTFFYTIATVIAFEVKTFLHLVSSSIDIKKANRQKFKEYSDVSVPLNG